jgi:hypothetical protein
MKHLEIDKKIKIISEFVPMAKPRFKGDEVATRYIIWNLYNRVCDAIKSFVILLNNQRYYDAFIIAGHALETCSVLSYIKDHDTEAAQTERYNKYMAHSALGRLIAILEMSVSLEGNCARDAYAVMLKIFHPVGASVIKDTKNIKEKHKEAIEKLNSREGSNIEKVKLLRKYYDFSHIREYLITFSDNLGNIDNGAFDLYYTKYCNYKHSNMLAPGALAGDLDSEEIDWFLNLVLGLIMYLDKSKLAPYAK